MTPPPQQTDRKRTWQERARDYYSTAVPVSEGVLFYPDAIDVDGSDPADPDED